MTEAEILNAIQVKYGREPDFTLWRNNTGQLREEWVTTQHLSRLLTMLLTNDWDKARALVRSLIAAPARYVRYGLCVGSSDLIGIVSVDTDHWVGGIDGARSGPCGIMLAAEVKRPGKHPTKEQEMFLDLINQRGGVAGCVHAVEEFGELLEKARAT